MMCTKGWTTFIIFMGRPKSQKLAKDYQDVTGIKLNYSPQN